MVITKIISGGQTGADRAGLEVAMAQSISHGGWCPKGRKALDGALDPKYQLKETPSSAYPQRTEWNVRDSDGTIIFSMEEQLTEGSLKTQFFAERHKKPWIHISLSTADPAICIPATVMIRPRMCPPLDGLQLAA